MNNTSSPYLLCINAEIKNGFTNCTKSNATVSLPIINIANQAVAQEPLISTVFKVLALVIVIILSLVGNFLTIGSIYQNVNKRMRTLSNYLIVNLSTADLLITICNMPRMILILLVGFEWRIGGNFGLLLCKITSTVPSLSLLVSTSSFVFIALDRFLAVFFPLRRPMTRNVMVAIIAFTWILPCCSYSLLFHYATLKDIYGKTYCVTSIQTDLLKTPELFRTFFILDFIIMSGIPIAAATTFYTAIGLKMCTRVTPGIQTASNAARNRMVSRKVISMLVAVLIAFCICWIPTWASLACLYLPQREFCNSYDFFYFKFFMSYFNSAVTPYIYPVFNQNFREGYVYILRQITGRCCFWKMCRCCSYAQVLPQQEEKPGTTSSRTERLCLNTTEL